MRDAILLAVSCHSELETGIAYFGGATGGTMVERFGFAARLTLESLSPSDDLLPLSQMANHSRPKEDEIIAQGHNERHAVGIRLRREAEQKKTRVDPGDPLDLQRQDEKDVNDLLRIEVCEGEEECGEKHLAGKLTIGENGGRRCSDHSNKKIQRETERTPGALETVADEPQKPERHDDQEKMARLWNEDVGDKPPDFASANPSDIKGEIRIKTPVQKDKEENKCVQSHDGADQSGNRDEAKTPFEFVQKAHLLVYGKESGPCFNYAGKGVSGTAAEALRRPGGRNNPQALVVNRPYLR
jgi:hypothetical protein